MKRAAVLLLMLVSSLAFAAEVSVGDVRLKIPAPAGFSEVTPDMAPLYDLSKQFVAGQNEELASFIPDQLVPAVRKGEVPELPRRFSLQVSKKTVNATASAAHFTAVKDALRDQNGELIKKIREATKSASDQINQNLADNYDTNIAFSVSQVVPMAPHEESDRSMAFSSYVNYAMNDETGKQVPFVVAMTTTFVHVDGKVLFLYTYGEKKDLEWTRQASKAWADAVLAANPGATPSVSNASIGGGVAAVMIIILIAASSRKRRKAA